MPVSLSRAKRIAKAYEDAKHEPNNPNVRRAYRSLITQVRAQYDALVDAGYTFTFFDNDSDPYAGNPWNAMRDLRNNKTMAVYSTLAGYGTGQTLDPSAHMMLEDTGLTWKDQNGNNVKVLANDLFRAVHDAFGHGLEGAGFRARGEENAWQAHARLFTGDAVAALTTETRGQNSWVNYGPYSELNRTAPVEDTVFAEQKMALLPSWVSSEGLAEADTRSSGQRWSLAEREEPKKVRSPAAGLLSWGTFSFNGTAYQVQVDDWAISHIGNSHGAEFDRFGRDFKSVIESITRTMLPSHRTRNDIKLSVEAFGNKNDLVIDANIPAARGTETVRLVLSSTDEVAPLRNTDRTAQVLSLRTAYVRGVRNTQYRNTIQAAQNIKYSVADPDLYGRAKDIMLAGTGTGGITDTFLRKLVGAVPGESLSKALFRNTVNRLQPAFELDLRAHNGQLPNVVNSVFKRLELAMAVESRVSNAVKNGPPQIDPTTGVISYVPGVRGIEQILGQIGYADLKDFHVYGIARREMGIRNAIRSGSRKGTRESFSPLSDAELQAIIDGAPQNFRDAFAELQNFNNHILNFAVKSGLLSREKANEFAAMDYLPFYRVLEDETGSGEPTVLGPAARAGLNNPRSALSLRLKGGDGAIGDLTENLIRNARSIIAASLKNWAVQKAASTIDQLNAMGDASYGERVQSADGQHIMRLYENGKPAHYRIDDPSFWAMLASMTPVQQNALMKAGSKFAQVLRIGVTTTPAFMIKNLVRGKISAYVTTDAPLDPFVGTLRAMRDVMRHHPEAEAMKAMSGLGNYAYGMEDRSISGKVKRNLRRAGDGYGVDVLQRWQDRFLSMIDGLENVGEATELAERLLLYRHLISKGMSEADAGYEAANLINFGRKGAGNGWLPSVLLSLIPLVPFLNARIQGIARVFENQKRQRTVFGIPMSTFMRGLVVTGISSAIWALNFDDDRWKEEPVENKMLNDIFYVGGVRFTIPRAFEVGTIFGALPVTLLDAIARGDGRDIGKSVAFAFLNTFAFNPIPQAVRPALEIYTNYDFFRGTALEPLSLQHLQPGDRVTSMTSGLSQLIGGATGISPVKLDRVIEGYVGGAGDLILATADAVMANMGIIPERPAGLFGDPQGFGVISTLLGGRSFARGTDEMTSRSVREFYDMKEAANEMMASYKEAILTNRPERAAEIAATPGFGTSTAMNRLAKNITDINTAIRMISRDPRLSAEEKQAQLAPLIEMRKQVARIGSQLGMQLGL